MLSPILVQSARCVYYYILATVLFLIFSTLLYYKMLAGNLVNILQEDSVHHLGLMLRSSRIKMKGGKVTELSTLKCRIKMKGKKSLTLVR